MRTYDGSCHCGAVRFRLRCPEITEGLRCNCSICTRKGIVMSTRYFAPEEIEVHGREALKLYQWGDREVNNWLCATCGVYPFHDATRKPGHYRVNLGCIDGVDTKTLALTLVDGRSF